MAERLLWQVARKIAENYDGFADPVDTPNNWARAIAAARDALGVVADVFSVAGNSSLDLAADEIRDELAE